MKRKSKGFTLIELLAVIVILAIIALIAIPIVLNIIERARKGAFTRSSENVLKASNLYYTNSLLDVSGPEDIRFECTKNECLSSKLDEKGNPINLNVDGNIGEGYVLITNKGEVEFLLQNGSYCVVKYPSAKNITVKNEKCSNIDITNDETAPVIDKINIVVTTNSIIVTVSAYDNESGISGYAFSIDGENYTDYQTNNVYKFNNLTSDKTYKINIRVYNGTYGKDGFEEAKGMSTKETEEITLKQIEEPTIEVSPEGWATEKTVTITYPKGYTNEYSIDNGTTFFPYTEAITFTANGNIIARITDGNNIVTKTQMIEKIDNTVPEVTIGTSISKASQMTTSMTVPFTANDSESGIKNIVCEYGTDENYGSNGTIENNTCIMNNLNGNTTYYYKITVTDNVGLNNNITGNSITAYTNGTAVYYNPEIGNRCTDYISTQSTTGTKTGCMRWYIYNDISSATTINMILDHNTTMNILASDIEDNLNQLNSNWQVNARLISLEEIESIVDKKVDTDGIYFDESSEYPNSAGNVGKYCWLHQRLRGSNIPLCPETYQNDVDDGLDYETIYWNWGYFTSTPSSTGNLGNWSVHGYGVISNTDPNLNTHGIRPVITINKY